MFTFAWYTLKFSKKKRRSAKRRREGVKRKKEEKAKRKAEGGKGQIGGGDRGGQSSAAGIGAGGSGRGCLCYISALCSIGGYFRYFEGAYFYIFI